MVERGIEPDVTAYNALLHVFAQECAAQRALELVDEMTEKVRMTPRVPLQYASTRVPLEHPSSTPQVPYCTPRVPYST
jgi:pentatricopeptide repeat protein